LGLLVASAPAHAVVITFDLLGPSGGSGASHVLRLGGEDFDYAIQVCETDPAGGCIGAGHPDYEIVGPADFTIDDGNPFERILDTGSAPAPYLFRLSSAETRSGRWRFELTPRDGCENPTGCGGGVPAEVAEPLTLGLLAGPLLLLGWMRRRN
jgi:hypothetical protein